MSIKHGDNFLAFTGPVAGSALGTVVSHIVSVIMNPNMTFYYRKTVTVKDFTSLKLYTKRKI